MSKSATSLILVPIYQQYLTKNGKIYYYRYEVSSLTTIESETFPVHDEFRLTHTHPAGISKKPELSQNTVRI